MRNGITKNIMNFLYGVSSSKDEKKPTAQQDGKKDPTAPDLKSVLRNSAGKKGLGLKPMKTWLWIATANTSAATTAQFPVNAVVPGNSSEFASLATLYDEYTVTRVKRITAIVGNTAGGAAFDWVESYDVADSTAHNSVLNCMQSISRSPVRHYTAGGGVSPLSVNSDGFFTSEYKVPMDHLVTTSGASNGIGGWYSTTLNAVSFGWFKAAVQASSIGTSGLDGYIGMLCTFRSRR